MIFYQLPLSKDCKLLSLFIVVALVLACSTASWNNNELSFSFSLVFMMPFFHCCAVLVGVRLSLSNMQYCPINCVTFHLYSATLVFCSWSITISILVILHQGLLWVTWRLETSNKMSDQVEVF
jgi:hypothetical protein